MISIAEQLQKMNLSPEIPKFASQRAELLSEIYGFYAKDYKRQTWKSYIAWLKQSRLKHSKLMVDEFKKSTSFYPKISAKSLYSFWLGMIPTRDLYYLISIAKDKEKRGESFNRWLFWALKA